MHTHIIQDEIERMGQGERRGWKEKEKGGEAGKEGKQVRRRGEKARDEGGSGVGGGGC